MQGAAIFMGGPIVIIAALILGGLAYVLQQKFPDFDLQSIIIIELMIILVVVGVPFMIMQSMGKG